MSNPFRKKSWSPYLVGAGIGRLSGLPLPAQTIPSASPPLLKTLPHSQRTETTT